MEFRQGMLGVVIVALALISAIFVGYLAGIEGEEEEYTAYEWLADVSGNFSYDRSPTYIEYEPSSNYVGYFSTDSGEYWPEDYVGYIENTYTDALGVERARVNNYKVNLAPLTDSEISDVSIASVTETDMIDYSDELSLVSFWTEQYSASATAYNFIPKTTTLVQLLSDLGYDGYDTIYIASQNDVDDVDVTDGTTSDPLDTGWVLFYPSSWVSNRGGNLMPYVLYISPKEVYAEWEWPSYIDSALKMSKMALSCMIDMNTGLVKLYWDNEYSDLIGTYYLSNINVAYSSNGSSAYITPVVELADSVDVHVQDFPDAEYLDPNYGVEMLE